MKDIKVGIVTFINTINYGASLQAYALQECVEKFGVRAEIIQYVNEKIEKKEKNRKLLSIRRLVKSLVMGSDIINKIESFQKFENDNIHRGDVLLPNSKDIINKEYDFFITGSDQVWNMNITHEDWTYFLNFVYDNKKKISYAASFGNDIFPQKCYDEAAYYLSQIPSLSVREMSGLQLIKKLTGREAVVVLDPTLLLSKKEWEERINFKPDLQHYILVYLPHNKQLVFEFVFDLKKATNLPVVYLSISPRPQNNVKTIYDASPDEFLGWMYYADYVVTGSFHGTAFSLNFEKQFYYEPSANGGRIENLVELTGTGSRQIGNKTDFNQEIDYSYVSKKLELERNKSKAWLKEKLRL